MPSDSGISPVGLRWSANTRTETLASPDLSPVRVDLLLRGANLLKLVADCIPEEPKCLNGSAFGTLRLGPSRHLLNNNAAFSALRRSRSPLSAPLSVIICTWGRLEKDPKLPAVALVPAGGGNRTGKEVRLDKSGRPLSQSQLENLNLQVLPGCSPGLRRSFLSVGVGVREGSLGGWKHSDRVLTARTADGH